jgi:hypothetical protein
MYRLDSHHRSASGRGVLTLTFSDMDELVAAAQRDRPPLASAACKVIITALGGVTQLNDAYGSSLSSSSIGSVP